MKFNYLAFEMYYYFFRKIDVFNYSLRINKNLYLKYNIIIYFLNNWIIIINFAP